jgi:hypothetical protein
VVRIHRPKTTATGGSDLTIKTTSAMKRIRRIHVLDHWGGKPQFAI